MVEQTLAALFLFSASDGDFKNMNPFNHVERFPMRRFSILLIFVLFFGLAANARGQGGRQSTRPESFKVENQVITQFIGQETDVVIPAGVKYIGHGAFSEFRLI